MAAAMPISYAVWSVLLKIFVIKVIGFYGADIGWLHTVREIPGFFFTAIMVANYLCLVLLVPCHPVRGYETILMGFFKKQSYVS